MLKFKRNDILNVLELCSGTLDARQTYKTLDLVSFLSRCVSNQTIDLKHFRYPHFRKCLDICTNIVNPARSLDTYQDILNFFLENWKKLENFTWAYRVLLDIFEMDPNLKRLK